MNPVLYLLIILAAVLFWLLSAFIFYPFGKLVYRIISDAIHELERDDKETDNEKRKE
jgi:hypothetical protein